MYASRQPSVHWVVCHYFEHFSAASIVAIHHGGLPCYALYYCSLSLIACHLRSTFFFAHLQCHLPGLHCSFIFVYYLGHQMFSLWQRLLVCLFTFVFVYYSTWSPLSTVLGTIMHYQCFYQHQMCFTFGLGYHPCWMDHHSFSWLDFV